jgi:uncharacterized lipoprotein YddW (UPF0748 family)
MYNNKNLRYKNNFKTPSLGWGLLFFLIFFIQFVSAQSPKRELRATWLTTVWQLDWPSVTVPKATGTNDAARQAAILQQKNGLISILNSLKAANMNAVYFQVRSMCDAMYQSSYEPWSQWISSERGADPGYDPLAYAIEEAHKRGMELHAWLNPYRYSTSASTHGNLPTDYFNTHPDWLLAYDSYTKILNPGIPDVVLQIKKIIGEIVNKYDIDGIVFDDYFYAYGGTSNTLDATAQALYKPAGKDLNDWRRENVNKMIAAVYDTIQSSKPYVKFGVSPFGTWTTDASVAASRGITLPSGVGTTGNMYAEIYCDPIAWLEQGKVDYISPQLYWTTYSSYPYGILAQWWSGISNRFGKHFYSSHSLSALTAQAPASFKTNRFLFGDTINAKSFSTLENQALTSRMNSLAFHAPQISNFAPSEIALQVGFNRTSDVNDAPGSVFYATDNTVNTSGFISYLNQNIFTQSALTPAISWKTADNQTLVDDLNLTSQTLTWTYSGTNVRFSVYAIPNANRNDSAVFSSSKYLLGTAYNQQFDLPTNVNSSTHKIAVAVLDRYGNEFSPRVYGENVETLSAAQLVFPTDNTTVLLPCIFKWNKDTGVDSFVWQLARDAQFTNLVCSRETSQAQFFSGLQTNLKDNVTYYWRVKTRKANAVTSISEVRKFLSHKFQISSPANGSGSVSLTPTFNWDNVSSTASYTLEISTAVDFNASKQILLTTLNSSIFTLPAGTLMPTTTYYARITVKDGSIQATSETVMFTTLDVPITVPQISNPINGSTVLGKNIQVCWNEQASKGFRVELAKDASFPVRTTTVKTVDASVYCATYESLTSGTYYVRVKAATTTGLTDPSQTVMVILNDNTAVRQVTVDGLNCYVQRNGQGEASIVIKSDAPVHADIKLCSLTGIVMRHTEYEINHGENKINLNAGNLPGGLYIIVIQTNTNKILFKVLL